VSLTPQQARPGTPVYYASRPGTSHEAVIDGEPFLLGRETWCVPLRGLGEEYRRSTCRQADYVPAAALHCLRLRVVRATTEGEQHHNQK
jgi:hypothetical protein